MVVMMRKTMRPYPLLCLWILAGCASSDFETTHLNELQTDCTETLVCVSSGALSSTDPSINTCVHASASALEAAPETTQQSFLSTVERCTGQSQCQYVSCTQNDPNSGYAATRQPGIQYDCQQRIGCKIAGGQVQSATAVADCVAEQSNALNASPDQQMAFDQKFTRCMGMTNCAWTSCQ
jgi:hypothetical protein